MRLLFRVIIGLLLMLPAYSQGLTRKAGRVIGQTLEHPWAKGWVGATDASTAVLHVEGSKPSILLLVGEQEGNSDLWVRYWVLPPEQQPQALKGVLESGLEYHFASCQTGLFMLSRSSVPLLEKGLRQKFEVAIIPSYGATNHPSTWVAFGGEGVTMTVHPEQANSEVARMATKLVDAARKHHGKQQHWYLRISPLWWWGSAITLAGCLGTILLARRKRRVTSCA